MKKSFLSSHIPGHQCSARFSSGQIAFWTLLLILASEILIVGLMCATPPISRDALIYHLAVPKLWLKHGGMYEIGQSFAYSPMNVNLLYLLCLSFGSDILPKFIHYFFGLATGFLIYKYLKDEKMGTNWALLGSLLFLSTPIVSRLSSEAYIDLGLTFFITLAVFAISRWRRCKYSQTRWLTISAVAAGLALGTDYSALISFVFLTLIVIYYYAKDRREPTKAVGYGICFAAIALLLFSPWCIRNYIWTSNPIYPHYNSFFNPHPLPSNPGNIQGSGISGFFRQRELAYGESFWEVLAIPIRFFFQGRDNSEQFFAGRLNPILVLALPFAFLGKALKRDRNFFLAFSAFFILSVYFVAAKYLRLILPALPPITILCAAGLKNLSEGLSKRHFLSSIVFGSIGIALLANGIYIIKRFHTIKPLPYVLGEETRDEFLSRTLGSYPAIHYINTHLPADARVSFILVGYRVYYIDRPFRIHAGYGMKMVSRMVQASNKKEDFVQSLHSLDSTHLLIRNNLFRKYLQDNFTSEEIKRFLSLTSTYWDPVYQDSNYTVFRIRLEPDSELL